MLPESRQTTELGIIADGVIKMSTSLGEGLDRQPAVVGGTNVRYM